ncbi:MAG: sugar ABC transporter ATP-binding protein [Xanthomonadales bacterium]|nr:sugar ABC transporter ATP-binding protein [Xanthomonadales bacterium]
MNAASAAIVPVGQPVLQAHAISKQYDGKFALERVDFRIAAGEVVTLAGENGAGKSTLVKIFGGGVPFDGGRIEIDGRPVFIRSPADARALGIAVVYQDFDLAPNLTVAENLVLGEEPLSLRPFVSLRRQRDLARARLAAVGLAVDPGRLVGDLGVAQRQLVAIARAIAPPVRLLILDEPTSALAADDIEHLLGLIRRQRAAGTAVLFITHKLDEALRVADRICVFRDGRNAGDRAALATSREEIVSLMVGRELQERQHRDVSIGRRPLLTARDVEAPGLTQPVNLSLHGGEILGLYGLKGAGRIALLRALFGLAPLTRGKVFVAGRELRLRSPRDAIRAGLGWVCRDRKELGLFANLDVGENLSIAALDRLAGSGFIRRGAERAAVEESIGRLGVKTTGIHQPINALSGGNQQKVLLARWLLCRPRVLILDEPTAGIDVGAKSEFYGLIHQLTAEGIGILLVSSELPEVLALSDRVQVMHEGAVRGELTRTRASEAAVMALIHGGGFTT